MNPMCSARAAGVLEEREPALTAVFLRGVAQQLQADEDARPTSLAEALANA